ncbi:MAG: hypothetical protein GY810_28070 [Aureispira sp.]|nr:hypothetical protein [Aureispira sp.]
MKTPSSDLFNLIHSLSKTEKRYFKTQAQRHVIGGKNSYVDLFDAIAMQKEFDEEKLKKKLAKAVEIKHWASTKKYLYEQLLDSLHQFRLTHSVEEKIKKGIHTIRILLDKQLYKQSEKLISKIRKLIIDYGLYEYMPELLSNERKHLKRQTQRKKVGDKDWYEMHEKMQDALVQIELKDKILLINSLVMDWHLKKGVLKKEEEKAKLDELMADKVLEIEPDHKNIQLYSSVQHIHTMYSFLNGNIKGALEHTQKAVKHIEDNPKLVALNPSGCLAFYGNLMNFSFQCKEDEEFLKHAEKFLKLPVHSVLKRVPRIGASVFARGHVLLLNMHLIDGAFDKIVELIPVVEKGIDTHKNGMMTVHLVNLQLLIALSYFGLGNYEKCLEYCDAVLDHKVKDVIEDFYYGASLLQLIAHYELGNDRLLESLLKNTRRRNNSKGNPYEAERLLFYYLNKLNNAPAQKEQKVLYELFLEDIQKVKEDTAENRPFQFFFYVTWLKSKVNNCSFKDAFQKEDADWRLSD